MALNIVDIVETTMELATVIERRFGVLAQPISWPMFLRQVVEGNEPPLLTALVPKKNNSCSQTRKQKGWSCHAIRWFFCVSNRMAYPAIRSLLMSGAGHNSIDLGNASCKSHRSWPQTPSGSNRHRLASIAANQANQTCFSEPNDGRLPWLL